MMHSSRGRLGLVVPTLNEAGNVPVLVERIRRALENTPLDYEIIFVDDDSQDGTAAAVTQQAQLDPRVRLFVRKGARGLAGAVIHGWENTQADFLGVIDADLQHPPEVLPSLIDPLLNGADIVIASRYISDNDSTKEWSKFRLFISRCGTLATNLLQRKEVKIKDPLSGFFIVRRECIEGIRLQPEGFKILLEILVKGRIRKAVEIPFRFGNRHSGKSKADVRVALQYFTLLGKLSRHALFGPGQQ